ncbi:hypothetical protein [uncultured Enterococcus sp.]|uniref:hypothetical protein n=1 Tax=uncultured Enterococcus sp. TaxID=167972 RepID=UPI002594FA7C|nr:hypothetical protein [uncultured Enterococcus sp.]
MKTVPLSTVFLLLRDIAYKMRQIDVDELDADYEQHLQRERDKPPELTSILISQPVVKSDGDPRISQLCVK